MTTITNNLLKVFMLICNEFSKRKKKCSAFLFHFSYISVVFQSKFVISGRWPAARAEKILTTFDENWPTLTPPYTKRDIHTYIRTCTCIYEVCTGLYEEETIILSGNYLRIKMAHISDFAVQ